MWLMQDARDGWASFADIKLEKNPQHGFILRTTRGDDERQLRANNPKAIILSLQKNGVHLTTSKLQRIAERMKEVEADYKSQQSALVSQVSSQKFIHLLLKLSLSGAILSGGWNSWYLHVCCGGSFKNCRRDWRADCIRVRCSGSTYWVRASENSSSRIRSSPSKKSETSLRGTHG